MTPLFRNIAIGTLCTMLAICPLGMDAQHRSGRGGGNHTSQRAPSRSGNNGGNHNNASSPSRGNSPYGNYRPGGNSNGNPGKDHASRPDNSRPHGNNNQGMRPGNNNNHWNGNHGPGTGPGSNGGNHSNQGMRPNDHNRPGSGIGSGSNHQPSSPARPQPGNNWRPGMGPHAPGHAGNMHRPPHPGPGPHPGHWGPPPLRPYRPVARPWHRPVPPPAWRPRPAAPVLSTILGITFGTALNISLNALINNGYYVDGYANNTVYLRDVNSYNYLWPDATLYYNNGGMSRSEFLYSTPYPDPMRYNSLYSNFMGIYGAPVNYVNNGTSLSATWFAPNRGYITLQYAPQYAVGGQLRYFTTLTLGL